MLRGCLWEFKYLFADAFSHGGHNGTAVNAVFVEKFVRFSRSGDIPNRQHLDRTDDARDRFSETSMGAVVFHCDHGSRLF